MALNAGGLDLPIINVKALSSLISPDARKEGFGQVSPPRIALMATQVSDAFGTKTRIDPSLIFDSKYLPSKAELNILGK